MAQMCGAAYLILAMLGPQLSAAASLKVASSTAWVPTACTELEPGVPCRKLYKPPLGTTFVAPCPIESMTSPDGCSAQFAGKSDADQCPQIYCPKALGVTMKLVCGGICCPTCWAPDWVVAIDRHTALDNATVVEPAPQAPPTCTGVRCFEPVCAVGFTKGHVQGNCCYSCVPGR